MSGDESASDESSSSSSKRDNNCPDDNDCKELGKRARKNAQNVMEQIENWHFHTKPCTNLYQTLLEAEAKKCDMTQPNFSYAIRVFNQVCTDSFWFPPPYAKPWGPPYQPH